MSKDSFFSVKDIFNDRRKLSVFLICVGLSVLMWLLISLGKDYSSTLFVPVKFVNFPENKTLLNEVGDELAVNVYGTGYDLLQYDGRLENDTLVVDLNQLKISVLGGYQQGVLDAAEITKELQDRINGALSINRVLSDSLKFQFDLKVKRSVNVIPDVTFQMPEGFVLLQPIYCLPNEVDITGALSLLDTLSYLPTEPLSFGELKKTMRTMVPIKSDKAGDDASLNLDSVQVIAEVDQLTEKSFLIEPRVLNLPDSIEMLLFPNVIEVSVRVPLSLYESVTAEQIVINVDFNELDLDYPILPVVIETWPTEAVKVNLRENQVEAVLTRKEQ